MTELLSFCVSEKFDEGDEEEAEEESYYYEFDGDFGVDGLNGVCFCGFLGSGLGFGLGGGVGLKGGAVLVGNSFAVGNGGESGGVTVGVGLDGDCGGLTHGVVDGEGNVLAEGVSRGHRAGLLRDGLAASATHCKQGKRRYEDSR